MLLSLLLACLSSTGNDDLFKNPGMSGIPVDQSVTFQGATLTEQELSITATHNPGGVLVVFDGYPGCPAAEHTLKATRAGPMLRLELATAEPQPSCDAGSRSKLEFMVQTSGPVFQLEATLPDGQTLQGEVKEPKASE